MDGDPIPQDGSRIIGSLKAFAPNGRNAGEIMIREDGALILSQHSDRSLLKAILPKTPEVRPPAIPGRLTRRPKA